MLWLSPAHWMEERVSKRLSEGNTEIYLEKFWPESLCTSTIELVVV